LAAPAAAQSTPVIFRGRVVMADGSAPGKSVGLQRTCSDVQGTRPGPLTEKDGTFVWRLEVDFMASRRCFIEATLNGYESTQVEISNVNPATGVNVDLAPIVLTLKGSDPYQLGAEDKEIPGKSRGDWIDAMKAVNNRDIPAAIAKLKAAVAASPKFAAGWHNLGILYNYQREMQAAREAYQMAIQADPKYLRSYAALARIQITQQDWNGAKATAEAAIPLDKNRIFPEMYLHKAQALYHLKDLDGAEASAREAINPKAKQISNRGHYVLGRILEAKGDLAGAKAAMTRYLELVPTAPDAAQIRAHIEALGQPGAVEPEFQIFSR
jgi:Flp pilus assembly protein TadD